jgi:hypothetical protein
MSGWYVVSRQQLRKTDRETSEKTANAKPLLLVHGQRSMSRKDLEPDAGVEKKLPLRNSLEKRLDASAVNPQKTFNKQT